MDLYTFALLLVIILVFIGLEFFRDHKYWNRIDRLLNRLQAQNYQEFRYYEDQYRRDLKNADDQIKDIRKKEEEATGEAFLTTDDKNAPRTPLNLEDLEEDWGKSEFMSEDERIDL